MAFDTVDRGILMEKLKAKGIKGKFLCMKAAIYSRKINEVVTEERISEEFVTMKGVRERCPLSPTYLICI